jgi:acyl-CoA thioesterase FadM
MEYAEHEYLRSRGLSVVWNEAGEHLSFPRVSASCDYLSPARFEDTIQIAVAVERIGQKSISYGFEFLRDGTVIAQGKMATVCCRMGREGKVESTEIPASFRAKLG